MNTLSTLPALVNAAYAEYEAEGVAVDEVGIGVGVVDWFDKHKTSWFIRINVNSSSFKPSRNTIAHEMSLVMMYRTACQARQYSFSRNLSAGGDSVLRTGACQ